MGRNYPRVASEGRERKAQTKSWMTLTSRNTEPAKDVDDSSPGGGGRAESRNVEEGSESSSKGDQLIQAPQGPPPLLKPHVLICPLPSPRCCRPWPSPSDISRYVSWTAVLICPPPVHAALVLGHLPPDSLQICLLKPCVLICPPQSMLLSPWPSPRQISLQICLPEAVLPLSALLSPRCCRPWPSPHQIYSPQGWTQIGNAPLQNVCPRRWKHLRCLIRLCLPSTAYVSGSLF